MIPLEQPKGPRAFPPPRHAVTRETLSWIKDLCRGTGRLRLRHSVACTCAKSMGQDARRVVTLYHFRPRKILVLQRVMVREGGVLYGQNCA